MRTRPGVTVGKDSDRDGLPDVIENATDSCFNVDNANSDNDGVTDGLEDINRNGELNADETNPCKSYSDEDGLGDVFHEELGSLLMRKRLSATSIPF